MGMCSTRNKIIRKYDGSRHSKAISLLRFSLAIAVIIVRISPNIQGWSIQKVFDNNHLWADVVNYKVFN